MTGWTFRSGKAAGQREKIWAIVRAAPNHTMDTLQILHTCHALGDPKLANIAPPAIRRCLQELRDYNPPLAEALGIPDTGNPQIWTCYEMREDIIKVDS